MVIQKNNSDAQKQHKKAKLADREPLTYEQLKPSLYKWAIFYSSSQFEVDELINAVWEMSAVQKVKHIKLASGRIKYDMIDYMRLQTDSRKNRRAEAKGKQVPKYISIETSIGQGDTNIGDLLIGKKQDYTDYVDYFEWLTKGMTPRSTLIVKLLYIEGLNQKEIAKIIGLGPSRVSQEVKKILKYLKAKLIKESPEIADREYKKGNSQRRTNQDRSTYDKTYYQANKERILETRRKLREDRNG